MPSADLNPKSTHEQQQAVKEAEKERKRKEKEYEKAEKYHERKVKECQRAREKEQKNARKRMEGHDRGYADHLGIDVISDLRLIKRAAGVDIRHSLPGTRWK